MPCEIYGGDDLLVFDKPFPFNAKKVRVRRCLPVLIRAKHGYLPTAALSTFQPMNFKFSSSGAARKVGMGSFTVQFSSLAFNSEMVCHRDSFLPPGM